jgi:hypothetical protein
MDVNAPAAERYLFELWQRSQGDAQTQVSMFETGAAIGLEKDAARRLAEDLIAEGLVEIKTLSGGIAITEQGIAAIGAASGNPSADLSLGRGPILEDKGRQALEQILTAVKNHIASAPRPYASLEELLIDIKTIEVQLLSPRPKTEVIRSVLCALRDGLQSCGAAELAGQLDRLTAK